MTDDGPWFRDVRVLWARPLEFFPTRDHTEAERLNAMVRFVLYSGAALAAYNVESAGTTIAAAAIIAVLLTVVFATQDDNPKDGNNNSNDDRAPNHHQRKPTTKECTPPTEQNPFMNVLAHEHGTDRPPACTGKAVETAARDLFERGIVRDIHDVYRTGASDRQFVTAPVTTTIPDTLAFRNFLFAKTRP
jgi:hypothetical protein